MALEEGGNIMTEERDNPWQQDPVVQRVCARLRELRKQRGFTLKELALATGLHPSTIQKIEAMDSHPTLGVLSRLTRALGVQMADLFPPSFDTPESRRLREACAAATPLTAEEAYHLEHFIRMRRRR